METSLKRCLKDAAGDQIINVVIKQEVEWLSEDAKAPNLANQEDERDMEFILALKTEEDVSRSTVSVNMAEIPKRCLEGAAGEQMPNVQIKQEVEWLAEDSHVPDSANQEVELDMESIRPIKTEKDPYHTNGDALAVQEFTPVPQKDEFIKAELILDEEIRDKMNDSEENSKQLDRQKQKFPCDLCERTCSTKANLKRHKKVHTKKPLTCEICGASLAHKGSLRIHMVWNHLDTVQSNTPVPRTADDATNTFTVEFLGEDAASYGQQNAQASESKSDTINEACEVCHCSFPTEYIRIHKRLAHSKPDYKCELCSRLFKHKYALKTHLSVHGEHGERDFTCHLCERKFYSQRYLRNHLKTHSTKPKHKCEFCPRLFKKKSRLESHLSTHATDRKKDFACDICERTFYKQSGLDTHMERYAQKDHPKFNCKVCWSSFTKKAELDAHLLTNHLKKSKSITPVFQTADPNSINTEQIFERKRFECGVCPRSFQTKRDLERHISIHSKDRKREFSCDLCQGKFYSKLGLWAHKKIHTRQQKLKPQPSNDTGVTMKAELMSDEEFIDEGNGRDSVSQAEKSQEPAVDTDKQRTRVGKVKDSVTCEICHKNFPEKRIETHVRIKHGDRTYTKLRACLQQSTYEKPTSPLDNHTPPFACEHCGFEFLAKNGLKQHMDTQHTENRIPLICEFCDKKFYSKHGLKEHLGTHTGVNVSCEVCGARFKLKQSLRMHMVRKHPAEMQPFTPDLQTASSDGVHTKEELKSDEEFLHEEMH